MLFILLSCKRKASLEKVQTSGQNNIWEGGVLPARKKARDANTVKKPFANPESTRGGQVNFAKALQEGKMHKIIIRPNGWIPKMEVEFGGHRLEGYKLADMICYFLRPLIGQEEDAIYHYARLARLMRENLTAYAVRFAGEHSRAFEQKGWGTWASDYKNKPGHLRRFEVFRACLAVANNGPEQAVFATRLHAWKAVGDMSKYSNEREPNYRLYHPRVEDDDFTQAISDLICMDQVETAIRLAQNKGQGTVICIDRTQASPVVSTPIIGEVVVTPPLAENDQVEDMSQFAHYVDPRIAGIDGN